MQNIADISILENLQNQANASMDFMPVGGNPIFNAPEDVKQVRGVVAAYLKMADKVIKDVADLRKMEEEYNKVLKFVDSRRKEESQKIIQEKNEDKKKAFVQESNALTEEYVKMSNKRRALANLNITNY